MDFLHSSETDVAYYILNLANKPIFFERPYFRSNREKIVNQCSPYLLLYLKYIHLLIWTLVFNIQVMVCGVL